MYNQIVLHLKYQKPTHFAHLTVGDKHCSISFGITRAHHVVNHSKYIKLDLSLNHFNSSTHTHTLGMCMCVLKTHLLFVLKEA